MEKIHESVLLNEVLKLADIKNGSNVLDATLDGGGHAEEILKIISPNGKLFGIEKDPEMIKIASARLSNFKNLKMEQGGFENLNQIVQRRDFSPDVILFDLGVSSYHFEKSARGFSFRSPDELDMRLDPNSSLTAKEIVNEYSEEKLESIFKNFGELRIAKKLSRKIIEGRRKKGIANVKDLVDIISSITSPRSRTGQTSQAFQALRIAVNNELGALKSALPQALKILKRGGRILIISFHSLEDRIVKNFLKDEAILGNLTIITKKPITPTKEEITKNKRSRSAKLRIGVKN